MVLQAPVLDDRTYDDLVAEARSRISRYAPEWTDLNDSDPGVALVQLFAWMSEALLFRIGRVPDLHFVKFLQLLGIQQRPAEPARTWLTFPLAENQQQAVIPIPRLTQVAAVDDPDAIFETEESLNAVALRVKWLAWKGGSKQKDYDNCLQGSDSTGRVELTQPSLQILAADELTEGLLLPFLEGFSEQGFYVCLSYPEKYTEKSDVIPPTQLSLTIFADGNLDSGAGVACGTDSGGSSTAARIVWEYPDEKSWKALAVDRDSTASLTRTGQVLLRTPPAGAWKRTVLEDTGVTGFWLRARLASGTYDQGRTPRLSAIRTNTVAAIQAQTHREEILGRSTGQPNQVFRLSFSPVLAGTLQLHVDEGISGASQWTEVADFFGSGPNDAHYVLDRATGEVRFGNGEAGRIPIATNTGDGIIALHYRHGGGRRGNLPAGTIKQVLSILSGIDDAAVHNPVPSVGGGDEETLQAAMGRAPQELKNKDRAVTAEDYEQLALRVPGIARARALPLAHPRFPCQPIPGTVTVVVVPDSPLPAPVPSESLLRNVCRWLEPRRVLTAEVFVTGPRYSAVSVTAEIVAHGGSDLADVARRVEHVLLQYFHPITGGESGTGWEFGGTIYYSLVYRQVLAVSGVQRIGTLTIMVDEQPQPPCVDIPLPAGHLAKSEQHSIIAVYSGA